jgi:hypothetical protein
LGFGLDAVEIFADVFAIAGGNVLLLDRVFRRAPLGRENLARAEPRFASVVRDLRLGERGFSFVFANVDLVLFARRLILGFLAEDVFDGSFAPAFLLLFRGSRDSNYWATRRAAMGFAALTASGLAVDDFLVRKIS